jgi:hypothetical protein
MGFAWVSDDTGPIVLPAFGLPWHAGPRHRRPTLLARGGHAVADRITALARPDLAPNLSAANHAATDYAATNYAATDRSGPGHRPDAGPASPASPRRDQL